MRPAIIALLAVLAAPVSAEEVIVKCFFDYVCDPNRKCDNATLDLRFRLDSDTNAVERIGGNGTSEFSLILGDRAITVLEQPITGGANTTTILTETGDSVHSANRIDGRALEPRQYVGLCSLT